MNLSSGEKTKGINEEMKAYDVGLICGRFQTYHIGHESLINMGMQLCDRILILIGSAQECGTERNPLNINTRTKMLREIYGDSPNIMIYGLADMTDENDIRPEWGKYLLGNVDRYVYKVPELMITGNDEERYRWFADEDVVNMSQLIVNRGKIPISATQVRRFMVEDDRKKWMEWVNPKLHKMYDEIRRELMSVPFYQNMHMEIMAEKVKSDSNYGKYLKDQEHIKELRKAERLQ